MGSLSKPYTISIWDEVWNENEGRFVEERFAIIGSNTMQSQNRALEPILTRNVNGTKKFSFKLCRRYRDNITGETVLNPFAEYLISEKKVKLEYDGEWFDFIVKNISEDSSKYIYTYQCEDALVNELSKNGFGVVLDPELVNNSGTLAEIANVVLEDTDWEVSSDVIVQTVEEPLVYIQIPAGTVITPIADQSETNKSVGVTQKTPITLSQPSRALAFYSSCRNKPVHFQFIYFSDESKYGKNVVEHNEDRVITEKDCQYYIEYLDPEAYTAEVSTYGFKLPTGFTLVLQEGGVEDTSDTTISTWHRGARYSFSQQTVYEPKLKRYVTKHNGPAYTEDGETKTEYRSYTSSEYISPELVQNIITNTDFKVSSGWTGTHFSTKNSKKASTKAVYGRFKDGEFISAITDLSDNATYEQEYTNHLAYMRLEMPKNTYVVNSGPFDNRVSIGQMEVGSQWALAIKNHNGANLPNVEYSLGEYEYDDATDGYKKVAGGITFTKVSDNLHGYIVFEVTSNPYLNKKEFKENSNVRLRIKNTGDATVHYIKSAMLFRVHYKKDGNSFVVPDSNLLSEEDDIGFVEEKYYYYKPSEMDTFLEEADFQPSICLDKPTYTTYQPIFHMNAEKIRSVQVKESNYFNILQTLAETFETWMIVEVDRAENGQITNKRIKYKQYIGEKNYANFRYGVNLKDIKRTYESKSLVTKLIVKDNSNEFAKNGFCSVARAKSNPLGENCLYDFQYYFNTGIMNARDHLDTMYAMDGALGKDVHSTDETTNALGYYPRIRALNDLMEGVSEEIMALNTGLIRLKADAEVEKAAKEAAQSGVEEASDSFSYLTGLSITGFQQADISKYEKRSDVQKQLIAYTTNKTELNRATSELTRLEDLIAEREAQIEEKEALFDSYRANKVELNKAFYTKYSRFIQEGTWVDEQYLEDEKYYADAQSVLYNSCYPQVTYSINVLALSALPGYELFKFGLGDRTFVEDPTFFGRDYKEEVVLTEFQENLDSPEKNTIKVQNFKNQFQDLFQKITATVQQAQYRTGSYEKAAALAEAASARKYQFLSDALASAEAILSAAGQQTVTMDKTGITITDDDSPCNQIRLVGGAILISTDDGNGVKKWKTAITHQGISASLVTAGILNAGEICIMNGQDPAFRWDAFGLTAFDATWQEGVVSAANFNKFVRMDKHGLYGMNGLDPSNNATPDGRTWRAEKAGDIDDYAAFYLTWDGLKVLGNSGVIARVGRLEGNIVNITKTETVDGKSKTTPLLVISNKGEVSIQIVSDLKKETETTFDLHDGRINARVSKDSKNSEEDGDFTRYCEWLMTHELFKVTAYKGSKDKNHPNDSEEGGILVDSTGLTVTGRINALAGGRIGGFNIESNHIVSVVTNADKTTEKKTSYNSYQAGVYIGPAGIGLGKYQEGEGENLVQRSAFQVSAAGYMQATAGKIGSFSIGSGIYSTINSMSSTAASGVYIGTDGIFIKKNANAFMKLNLGEGSFEMKGKITATSGKIADLDISNGGISSTYFSANASGASIEGFITAKAGGKIGNFTIGTGIYSGISTIGNTDNKNGIYIGTDGLFIRRNANQYIKVNLAAGNGVFEIKGKIIATSGTIGGCLIDEEGNLKINSVNIGSRISTDKLSTDVVLDGNNITRLNNNAGYKDANGVKSVVSNAGYKTETELTTLLADPNSKIQKGVVSIVDGVVTAEYILALGIATDVISALSKDTLTILGDLKVKSKSRGYVNGIQKYSALINFNDGASIVKDCSGYGTSSLEFTCGSGFVFFQDISVGAYSTAKTSNKTRIYSNKIFIGTSTDYVEIGKTGVTYCSRGTAKTINWSDIKT